MTDNQHNQGQAHLDRTLAFVRERLRISGVEMEKARQDIYKQRAYIWDNVYVLKADEAQMEETEMGREMHRFRITQQESARLLGLVEKPFFARVDFKANDEDHTDALYIGQGAIFDTRTFESYVHDWRAPISSLYYDYECGPAGYASPDGEITGELTLKRQYEIEKGVVISQFDTQVAIRDALLSSILSKGASSRMHDIVSTIQRGQNAIIRDGARVLVVQGAAGSGKTSIALHRIAYLLYQRRNTLKSGQVIIFSPNEIFSDYISQVLPSLGEENVWQTSFDALAQNRLSKGLRKQTQADWLEDALDAGGDNGALVFAREKAGAAFAAGLERFMDDEQERFAVSGDAVFADCGVIVAEAEINGIYRASVGALGMAYSLKRVETLFYDRVEELKKEAIERWADEFERDEPFGPYLSREEAVFDAKRRWDEEMAAAQKHINARLRLSPAAFYRRYLVKKLGIEAGSRLKAAMGRGVIPYEDVAPMLWIMCRLGLLAPVTGMRHVVVDEAQDYTALHYMTLKRLYPRADFTILGDAKQTVNPAISHESLDYVADVFGPQAKRVTMDKTYRLTSQICAYANARGGALTDAVGRQGEPVREVVCHTIAEKARAAHEFFCAGGKGGLQAIITRTLRQAILIRNELNNLCDCRLLSGSADDEIAGLMALPYYLAKGLEFDDVAVDTGDGDGGRYAYISCTRAMKRLLVIK